METEKDTHRQFDFQGGSLQLFRDSSRHTHRHTPWSELCQDNGGSSVINNSITLSLLCIASLLSCFTICMRVLHQGWGPGECVEGLVSFNEVLSSHAVHACICVWVCVWGTHRKDFPFSGCPLPWAFGPFMSVTLHSPIQIQNSQTSFSHSVVLWPVWLTSQLKIHLFFESVFRRKIHYVYYYYYLSAF